MEGRHTTLTEERQVMSKKLGFVWDSHAAAWNERVYGEVPETTVSCMEPKQKVQHYERKGRKIEGPRLRL
ncbi:unnamed protein product [Cylindrotheca closterium]|uniref:Uncharacterized protein n=1 Tax=Cylindrotheca closterium TaxID=2856 RepID=A0AAD2CUB7_9STRA|nr:unnamed protein product [Cylindrotheca closterium]